MTDKLILKNRGDDFFLLVRTENSESVMATLEGDGFESKLSLKNCQAIKRGYDLDELADILLAEVQTRHKLNQPNTFRRGVIKGFQKALEILGDKKFSEEFIVDAYYCGRSYQGRKDDITLSEYLQSLQQTEWDVEIVQEQGKDTFGNAELTWYNPKIDAEGCLILKRT